MKRVMWTRQATFLGIGITVLSSHFLCPVQRLRVRRRSGSRMPGSTLRQRVLRKWNMRLASLDGTNWNLATPFRTTSGASSLIDCVRKRYAFG
ncbi:hypothetical protein DL96DRAFT_1610188 [Flagelloscypha sp. PMI_526]|nr:hypothetical protein DL96DRAFT_1610188 [Flagelloscypha sp. PMI_526]